MVFLVYAEKYFNTSPIYLTKLMKYCTLYPVTGLFFYAHRPCQMNFVTHFTTVYGTMFGNQKGDIAMEQDLFLPKLRREERITLQLRALFEERGYRLFKMGSFEEYDLYMQNKPFLMGDDIITFTGSGGRLMALKPDVTLSIVKNTPAGDVRRIYYLENVFRRSRHTGEYREISQMGLEFIGGEGGASEEEVLCLAAKSLAACGTAALDLSHMEFIEAMLGVFQPGEERETAKAALQSKSPHAMREIAEMAHLTPDMAQRLVALTQVSGGFDDACAAAAKLAAGVPGTEKPLARLSALAAAVQAAVPSIHLQLDFSILNDADYYNGLIFQGFVAGVARPVLFGGRYDNLLRRFDKPQGAIGFALYLDALGQLATPVAGVGPPTHIAAGTERPPDPSVAGVSQDTEMSVPNDGYLNIALPKGRLGDEVYKLFSAAGFPCRGITEQSRKLVFEDDDAMVRYFLVKPTDVDIYVEHGAADIGVAGKDVLLEHGADVLEVCDLRLGGCRLAVAGRVGFVEDPAATLRVATKYPNVARRYYAEKSRSTEIIKLHGSIELAPLLGLADVIVDIVQTGGTLKENDLEVLEEIAPSSARLIVNRAAWRFKGEVIRTLAGRLENSL